jgi:exopolyphosphatase/guanosine-5'-triphosphate,3'-diphosphate pyrophosphatase
VNPAGGKGTLRAWWSSPSDEDMRCISAQLQREPRIVIAVARRCRFGFPQVIVTSPVVWGPGRRSERKADVASDDPRVFPTLFWLSCPYLVSAVGRVESQGWVGRVKLWLDRHNLQEMWQDVHRRAAGERLAVLSEDQEHLLREAHPSQWQVLMSSGVGGTRSVAGIKCLHAHLADYMAGPVGDECSRDAVSDVPGSRNPVGAKTLALLLQDGVDVSGCAECVCGEPPAARRLAAIDVGSNSCRLLAVDVDGEGHHCRSVAAMESTRLAEGLQERGILAPDALARTLRALGVLHSQGRQGLAATVVQVMAVATSAMREASNPEALLWPAWEQLGLPLRVISGEEEAQLSFRGAIAGWQGRCPGKAVGVLDIGGGSTELVVGTPESGATWSVSVEMGAVRLKDGAASFNISEQDVEALTAIGKEALQGELSRAQVLLPDGEAVLLGVGGTLTSLAAIDLELEVYDSERIQGYQLTRERIAEIATKLAALPLTQRQQVPGLQPERADIIVAGAAIALAAMAVLQQEHIIISEADILQGMIESFQVRSTAR